MIYNIIILISLLAIVALNPIGDAVRDNGNKRLQKTLEGIRDLVILFLFWWVTRDTLLSIGIGVILFALRIGIHNLIYNMSRRPRLPWYFTGTTSASDDVESKMDKRKVLVARIATVAFSGLIAWLTIFREGKKK